MAISILDRYLHQATVIHRSHLQTIGTAALLLAAKLEEVVPPDIWKLVDFGDGAVELTHLVKVVRLLSFLIMWLKLLISGGNNFTHSKVENKLSDTVTISSVLSPIAVSNFEQAINAPIQRTFTLLCGDRPRHIAA